MYQLSKTTPVYLSCKNFVIVLILSNKYFFCKLLGWIWKSAIPLCMDCIKLCIFSFMTSKIFVVFIEITKYETMDV